MDKSCGTCKSYRRTTLQTKLNAHGTCERLEGRGSFLAPGVDNSKIAYASNGDGAEFRCKPDFGCVLHEPKSPKADPAAG